MSWLVKLGYGFLIDSNECVNMSDEQYDAFVNSDFCVEVDEYCDNPKIFFGLTIYDLEPGEAVSVPNIRQYSHDKFIEMMDEFKLLFPKYSGDIPRDYILFCID